MAHPRVTFHDATRDEQLSHLSRFASSAAERRLTMLVVVRDAEEPCEVDALLWAGEADSFLPHAVWRGGEAAFEDAPILVAEAEAVSGAAGASLAGHVIVQLSPAPEQVARRFSNVVDFVDRSSEAALAAGRQRFLAWRRSGANPEYRKTGQEESR
jgi:DNA polymerase IIIc chi subunit